MVPKAHERERASVTVNSEGALDRLLGTVGESMTASVLTLDAGLSGTRAALELERAGVSGAPVVRHARVVGVITLKDLAERAGVPGARTSGPFLRFEHKLPDVSVDEIMSGPPLTVREDLPLARACEVMETAGVNRLPVVDERGHPIGILTRDDVVRTVARRARTAAHLAGRPQISPD